jgi:hypothetical protein
MSKNTNLSFLTDYITADITNGRIGINNASPTVAFDVSGATKISGVLTLTSTISNGTYTYTLPSATGTLALTSAISGTTNYVPKFTASGTIGNSVIFDNGTNVGIGSTSPSFKLETLGTSVIVAGFGRSDYGATNVTLVGLSGYRDVYKSAIGVVRTGDYDVGNMIFCLNSAANSTAVSASDERMRITSEGNVGIGTSSPSTKLQVTGSAVYSGVVRFENNVNQGDVNHGILNLVNTASYVNGNDASLMFSAKDNEGTVHPRASIGMKVSSSATSGDLVFNTRNDSAYAERMRITSDGNVQINNAAGLRLYTEGNGAYWMLRTYNAVSNQLRFNYQGTDLASIATVTGNYTALSDINKKKDFEQSEIGLNEVLGLKPTLYRMKTEDDTQDKHLGFIAQEVKEFIPQAYSETGEGDDKFIGLTEMPIIAALTKAIQELSAKVTLLENK